MKGKRCLAIGLAGTLLAACTGGESTEPYRVVTGGEPETGAGLIREFGCGSCHTVPGIRNARGMVGPPLMAFSKRTYIAGRLPNNPRNLVHWIREPQQVDAKTAMPHLGVSEQQARHIAAYLYSLD